MSLGALIDEKGKAHKIRVEEHGVFKLDEDDYMLVALLSDPIYCAELLGEDHGNREHAGAYHVRDYQYPLFRLGVSASSPREENYAGAACARSTGKTESIIWRAVSHAFRRVRRNLLVTAPELIHLLPLTDQIEDRIRSVRLCREFLDTRGGKTGFTHRPFGVDYEDGTKIVGRIPRLTGTGVKGQHEPDLMVEEAQDYPSKGWTELHETVLKDSVDAEGEPDFHYHFYGVHSGARDSGFYTRATEGGFEMVNITALQRHGWNAAEKTAAIAAYGGTSAPDYRRNILGEAGGAASPYFVVARLVACVDQNRESDYNVSEYRHQVVRVEEFDEMQLPIGEVLDLPSGYKNVVGGMDVGLTTAPTVILLFSKERVGNRTRLKLIRRITLERMRTKNIRHALYAIAWHYGTALKSFGMDVTGLGFPIWQEVEDDEHVPQHLLDVARGYFFNAKVPVHVDKKHITEDNGGNLRDQFGNAVVREVDPLTGQVRYVTYMPMIEASTKYIREDVDQTRFLFPFDTEITGDMQGETDQRVKRISGLKQKPNAFHILDAMRAMEMADHAGGIEAALESPAQTPVLDLPG